eukprot:TRINITY_DN72_c0_g1_i4.p1 TRINITY_DN72_c0_g1~~TRINITY_DN72_c0_g1_i4.p1  ORF type:complete len:261 (+),score=99.45 TRINITY_DN72_c0_g1_i4:68-850(+)
MQFSAILLLALAASTQAQNVTSTNGTNATSSSPATTDPPATTKPPTEPPATTQTPAPVERAIPEPGNPEQTSERAVVTGVFVPSTTSIPELQRQLHDAIETSILETTTSITEIDTIVEFIETSINDIDTTSGLSRQAHALNQVVQVRISFRDTKKGLSAEETLRRKCMLDNYVIELQKQLADPESALRQEFEYLTGDSTAQGLVSKTCVTLGSDDDDDLSGGPIAGIVLGSLVFIGIIAAVVVVATKKPAAPSPTEPVAA